MENSDNSSQTLAHDAETVFRAVDNGAVRRGIRLERIYWNALKEISRETRQRTGILLGAIEAEAPEAINVTSLTRVYCLRWFMNALQKAHELTAPHMLASLVRASPSAAFALGFDKRIIAYNQSFLNFIQVRFAFSPEAPISKDLRLAIDIPVTELMNSLKANENAPIVSGFVVGVGDRRVRGNLNAILAPVSRQDVILCYVLSS